VCMPPPNAAPVCNGGKCDFECQSPLIRCGMSCIDPRTDLNNCGGCNKMCPMVPGGVATCSDNQCGVSCAAGNSACNGQCVNTNNDVANCGGCGKKCPGKKPCALGLCLP
jgi:hypothetical protein